MTTDTIPEPPVATPEQAAQAAGLARRAVRGGAVLMAARLAMQGFVWAVSLLVARLLLPDDYGLMTAGMVFLGLADLLAEAGVGKALVQRRDLAAADVARAFTLSLLLSALLYAMLFAVAGPAGQFLGLPGFAPFLRVLGLLVLLVPCRAVAGALLDRELRLERQAAVHVLLSVVQSGLVLALALAGAGYWALAGGAIAGRALETAALVALARWRPALAWPLGAGTGGLVRFGLHVSLGSLLWFICSNSDFAIVGAILGVTSLGYYALAFQLISLPVQKLTVNLNQAVYPVFCRLQDDPARLRDWFLRLSVLLGLLGMPALVGMALVAPDAFALVLGERWLPAVLPFQLLSLVGVLMVYSHALSPLFNALGRPDVNLRYTAVCTLLFPLAFLVGGRLGGVDGVCLAWLVLYPLLVGLLVGLTRRITGVGLLDLARAQAPVAGAVLLMASCVVVTRRALNDDRLPEGWAWLRLVLSIVVGAGVYAGVLPAGTAARAVRGLLTGQPFGGVVQGLYTIEHCLLLAGEAARLPAIPKGANV
jgi:PST family polysaccharide transporter